MIFSRIDLIGQNGNTGEHYMSEPIATKLEEGYWDKKTDAIAELKAESTMGSGADDMYQVEEEYVDKVARFVNDGKPIINPHMQNDGGSASYYELPKDATELSHLIAHKRMPHPIGEAFCSLYRLDDCPHSDRKRNIKKVMKYMEIELENMERGVM